MKKIYLPIFVITMVVISVGIWIFQGGDSEIDATSKIPEIIQILIIIVLFIFGIIIAISRIRSESQGLPADDELSKKIRQKSAAWSYYFSLYIWVGALYLYHETSLEGNIIIGSGILCMAIMYGVFNLLFSKIGKINE